MSLAGKYAAIALASPIWCYVRIILLVALGAALMQPYLTHGTFGGGDTVLYANAVSDFVLQVRAGIFPVWVGQTEFALLGVDFPLRFAPYLQHLAALVDLATGRSLPPFFLLNVALSVSLIGGLLSCYFCLLAVVPQRPWAAFALALLYASCPGVIGLAYAQDLYMSASTLPFLPVVFLGMIRVFERDDLKSRLLMAGGLAGAWLAHPPIALWVGLVAVAAQGVRIFHHGWNKRARWLDCLAITTFFFLAEYSIVSVSGLVSQSQSPPALLEDILFQIHHSFPGNWLPVVRQLSLENLQAGYSLTALFLLCAGALFAYSHDPLRIFFVVIGVTLLALVMPIPFLTETLWHLVPQTVLNITRIWPMQRLLIVFALCAVFGAALLGRQLRVASVTVNWVLGVLLIAALAWSGFQASQFIKNANLTAPTVATTMWQQRSENLVVVVAGGAYGLPPPPRYASGGVMDPGLENHLLDIATRQLQNSATDAIAPGFGPGVKPSVVAPLTRSFTGKLNPNPGILDLLPTLKLEPRQRYLLVLELLNYDYTGILIISGREFYRQYRLPLSGESRSFGAGPESSRIIPLWTSLNEAIEVQLQFVPTNGKQAPMDYVPFARFDLRAYNSQQLPIQLESLLPYRATISSDKAVYLETSRLYIPSYKAAVDGVEVPVQVSADGYVIIPVNPGTHKVTLEYIAPLALRISFWLGAASWAAWGVALLLLRSSPFGRDAGEFGRGA